MGRGKYEEMANTAERNKTAGEITVDFVKLETVGDAIVGQIVHVSEVIGSTSQKPYNQYLIDTDQGLRKTQFGGAYDAEMAPFIRIGGVYKWIYQGPVKLANGHTIHKYKTMEISTTEAKQTVAEFTVKKPE